MAGERWNKKTDTRKLVYLENCKQPRQDLQAPVMRFNWVSDILRQRGVENKPYEKEVQINEYVSYHFEWLQIW